MDQTPHGKIDGKEKDNMMKTMFVSASDHPFFPFIRSIAGVGFLPRDAARKAYAPA